MGKKSSKKNKNVVIQQLESDQYPILEFKSTEENYFFNFVPHPSKPIVSIGLATGHIYTIEYNAEKLLEYVNMQREESKKQLKKDAAEKKALEENGQDSSSVDEKRKAKKIFWKIFKLEDLETGSVDNTYIKILWKTKRHKGSCRCICFNGKDDGETMYSIGTDNVLKKANSLTGKVIKKLDLNEYLSTKKTSTITTEDNAKFTKLVKSPTHDILLLGSENGNVLVLNSETLEITNDALQKIHNGDAINDIFQYVKKSAYKFISLGQTTLASWDSRPLSGNSKNKKPSPSTTTNDGEDKPQAKIQLSDDQEDEMLCGTFLNPEDGDIIVCGMGEGILTIWKPKKNDLQDQLSRIKIAREESIDCIIPTLQDDNCVWCGCSNGNLYKVNVKMGKVVEIRKHSKFDEVTFLDLDCEYRVTSGGMENLKIWELDPNDDDDKEEEGEQNDDDEDNDSSSFSGSDDSDSFSDSDSDSEQGSDIDSDQDSNQDSNQDSANDSLSDSDNESLKSDDSNIWEELAKDTDATNDPNSDVKNQLLAELDSSSDEEIEQETKKQTKGSQNDKKRKLPEEDKSTGNKKLNKKQLLKAKQLKNMQNHEHGIRKFEGL